MNSHPMSMNLSSTILIFSLLTCATSLFVPNGFRISAYLTVSCEKPVNADIKVFLMDEDIGADDDIARKLIHLTPENRKKQVKFHNVTVIESRFESVAEIYLAFLHNCTGEEREYCTHYKEMGHAQVHNFGHVRLGTGGGRKCPTGDWHNRPMPENPTVSVAVNATCANLTGPVHIKAILEDEDHGFDDAILNRDFTLSPEHRVESMNYTELQVGEGPGEEHVELYWIFIHTCGGVKEETASCGPIFDVKLMTTFNFPPMVIDSLPKCHQAPWWYKIQRPENRV